MPSYCVSGAGTNAYNGTYDPFSASEYRKVGTPTIKIIYNGDELWYFIDGSTEGYTIGSSSATPPLTGWNVSGNGVSTAPTLTEGACASPTTTTTTTTAAPLVDPYCVSGAGTAIANGTYSFVNSSYNMFMSGYWQHVSEINLKMGYGMMGSYEIYNEYTRLYYASSLTGPWTVEYGTGPAPTVASGECGTTTTTTTAAPTTTTTTAAPTTTTTTTLSPDKIRIKRSSSSSAVPATLLLGEIAANIVDKKIWIGNSSNTPILISDYNNSGSQGFQGSQGLQGLQGNQGAAGTNGSQGNQGYQGVVGTTGSQGLQGLQGAAGINGSQGFQGLTGTGNQGWQGEQGWQGHQGNQGWQGDQGFQGRQGFQGHQGDQGWQGEQGFQGHQGDQGNYGWQGYQGSQGDQGMYGWQGWQGSQGDQGMYGWQGYQGSQGDQGQGNQGSQGSQGLQGLTGPVAGSANQVVYKDGSNVAAGSSSFTFNGTTVTTPVLAISPTVGTGTQPSSVTVTAPNHTALTAATEYSDVFLNLNRTVQFSAGFLSSQRAIKISAPTYSAVSASTFTNAATIQIDSAPIAGTNLTLTNAYALRVLTGTDAGVGIVIRGSSSQSGDLFRIQNFGETKLLYVDSNYSLYLARSLNLTPFNTSAGNTSEIRFYELAANGTHYVGFKAGDSIASNVIWTLPTTDGANGGVIITSGAGVLSWSTAPSAASNVFLANNFGGL